MKMVSDYQTCVIRVLLYWLLRKYKINDRLHYINSQKQFISHRLCTHDWLYEERTWISDHR